MKLTYKRFIGLSGELLFSKYLKNKGFTNIKNNIRVCFGELDVLAYKNNKIYFFEVKTVTYETKYKVSRETYIQFSDIYSYSKHNKFIRAVFDFLNKEKIDFDENVILITIILKLDFKNRVGKMYYLKNL